jgi:hypothetical protein
MREREGVEVRVKTRRGWRCKEGERVKKREGREERREE